MEKKGVKKPIYKRWWFWIIALLFIFIIFSNMGKNDNKSTKSTSTNNSAKTSKKVANNTSSSVSSSSVASSSKETVPADYTNALAKGKLYATEMNMSKQGVYDQLTSEYGEKFSAQAAQYAIDNLTNIDWNANALAKARSYQKEMSMSPDAIRDQLTSDNGEKFTADEANYAIQHLNDN